MVKLAPDGIIFDLDGTLWSAVDIVLDAWNSVIARYPNLRSPIGMPELKSYMGTQLPDIAKKMFPNVSPEERARLIDECCALEHEFLAARHGTLYPKVQETLEILAKSRIPLFIVSNCEEGYIECFLETCKLEKYFTDFMCAGNSGKSKGENNKTLMLRNRLHSPIYVGDTQGDAQSAIDAEIPFIWAKYGFGCVEHYNYSINSFEELLDMIETKI